MGLVVWEFVQVETETSQRIGRFLFFLGIFLLFYLGDVHDFDGGQLTGFRVATLVEREQDTNKKAKSTKEKRVTRR